MFETNGSPEDELIRPKPTNTFTHKGKFFHIYGDAAETGIARFADWQYTISVIEQYTRSSGCFYYILGCERRPMYWVYMPSVLSEAATHRFVTWAYALTEVDQKSILNDLVIAFPRSRFVNTTELVELSETFSVLAQTPFTRPFGDLMAN